MARRGLRVGLSRDFLNRDGSRAFDDEAWSRLAGAPGLELGFLEAPAFSPVTRRDVERYDVLIIKRNPVEAALFEPDGQALRLVVRNGAGYDHIDVEACTRAGVAVAITPGAVTSSVASAILALVLALAHRLFERDRATRAGRWSERWERPGMDLAGRTLGIVGLGRIGLETLRLAAPWGMRHLGYAPRPRPERYAGLGVETVDLDTLLAQSDFVVLCCPLDAGTRHLIDARALARMGRQAYLVNTARGEIVDEPALVEALRAGRIAGAGIDVFESEPPAPDHPLYGLDNVILGSHNLAYSDGLNRAANLAAVEAVLAYAGGCLPRDVLNPGVLAG